MEIERFPENPLLVPASDDRIGDNVNGPSVIRVPEWVEDPLGEYYMYFAHHDGESVRLAYADDLRGPWEVYGPGALHRDDTRFDRHVASPDVHVDDEQRDATGGSVAEGRTASGARSERSEDREEASGATASETSREQRDATGGSVAEGRTATTGSRERVRLYFHGCCGDYEVGGVEMPQVTDVATSSDGLDFEVRAGVLGNSYFRVWEHDGRHYALANDGRLYRADDPLGPFERGPELFDRNRHFAVRHVDRDVLQVFLTRRGDRPERIMATTVDLAGDWRDWTIAPDPPETVLWPERKYEGGHLPVTTSEGGMAEEPVRALRDPALFEEDGRVYLFYAIAGEQGIAGAEVRDPDAIAGHF